METKPGCQDWLHNQSLIYSDRPFTIPEVGLHDSSHHFLHCLCLAHPETQVNGNGFPTEVLQVDMLLYRLQNLPQVIHSHPGDYLLLSEAHLRNMGAGKQLKKQTKQNSSKSRVSSQKHWWTNREGRNKVGNTGQIWNYIFIKGIVFNCMAI